MNEITREETHAVFVKHFQQVQSSLKAKWKHFPECIKHTIAQSGQIN